MPVSCRRPLLLWSAIALLFTQAACGDHDGEGAGGHDRGEDCAVGPLDTTTIDDGVAPDGSAVDASAVEETATDDATDVAQPDVLDATVVLDVADVLDALDPADAATGSDATTDATDATDDAADDAQQDAEDVAANVADVADVADTADIDLPPPPPVAMALAATPSLLPGFAPAISDYVVACALPGAVTLSFDAEAGATVAVQVQGASAQVQPGVSGVLTVTLDPGQRVTVSATAPGRSPVTTHLRCLPADFPAFAVQTDGAAGAEFYLASVQPPLDPKDGVWKPYPVVWDRHGVPLWWGKSGDAVFFTLLANGKPAWTRMGSVPGGPGEGAVEVEWDGSVVKNHKAVGGDLDIHDLIRLPDGSTLLAAWTTVPDVDLTAIGGPAKASIFDQVLQEVAPDGSLVWSWSAAAHIPVSEMSPTWQPQFIDSGKAPYDVHHWNAVDPIPGGYLLSFRHLDAVYAIDRATGDVVWKLGGTTRPESLSIVGDPVFPFGSFGGQHDARMLADGSVTLHDNGSGVGRPPRMLRYHIAPPPLAIATLLEAYSDATIGQSICCGSTRKLDSGAWVIGFGGRETITEVSASGKTHFRLVMAKGALLYRAVPVSPGQIDRATLRAGMDAQYP